MPLRRAGSMEQVIPKLQQRLAVICLLFYLLFALTVSWRMLFSPLKL
jgi:hypothetical protein